MAKTFVLGSVPQHNRNLNKLTWLNFGFICLISVFFFHIPIYVETSPHESWIVFQSRSHGLRRPPAPIRFGSLVSNTIQTQIQIQMQTQIQVQIQTQIQSKLKTARSNSIWLSCIKYKYTNTQIHKRKYTNTQITVSEDRPLQFNLALFYQIQSNSKIL